METSLKLLAFSKNGGMLKFEDSKNPKGYSWFFLAPNVQKFAKTLKVGDVIHFKYEERNGEDTIIFIGNPSGAVKVTTQVGGGSSFKEQRTTYGKSPEEQENIKRMSLIKTAGDAVATCLQGQLDVKVLGQAICELYDVLYNKINT